MTAPTPTDAEMVAWCEQAAMAAQMSAEQWRNHPDGCRWYQDTAMLRAIAARLWEQGR